MGWVHKAGWDKFLAANTAVGASPWRVAVLWLCEQTRDHREHGDCQRVYQIQMVVGMGAM